MNPIRTLLSSRKLTLAAIALAVVSLAPSAYANPITINFDSVAVAPGASVSGATVTNYLAGYGVTLSGMLPGESAYIFNASTTPWMAVPSSPNVFIVGGINPIDTVTLNFATPADNFSFDRVGNIAAYSPSGTTKGPWSATAYNAANVSLGSVGEGYIGTYGDVPTVSFSLLFSGIDHIAFTGNSYGFAGTNMPILDDFSFTSTSVPEPASLALVSLGLVGVGFIRRKKA